MDDCEVAIRDLDQDRHKAFRDEGTTDVDIRDFDAIDFDKDTPRRIGLKTDAQPDFRKAVFPCPTAAGRDACSIIETDSVGGNTAR